MLLQDDWDRFRSACHIVVFLLLSLPWSTIVDSSVFYSHIKCKFKLTSLSFIYFRKISILHINKYIVTWGYLLNLLSFIKKYCKIFGGRKNVNMCGPLVPLLKSNVTIILIYMVIKKSFSFLWCFYSSIIEDLASRN